MNGGYIYCQSPECGVYLGSLGGDSCSICNWSKPPDTEPPEHEEAEDASHD